MRASKIYVEVIVKTSREGDVRPLSITWEDDTTYEIDRVRQVCEAASLKVGGCGTRYTVVVGGKEIYLFHEQGRWFVEGNQVYSND